MRAPVTVRPKTASGKVRAGRAVRVLQQRIRDPRLDHRTRLRTVLPGPDRRTSLQTGRHDQHCVPALRRATRPSSARFGVLARTGQCSVHPRIRRRCRVRFRSRSEPAPDAQRHVQQESRRMAVQSAHHADRDRQRITRSRSAVNDGLLSGIFECPVRAVMRRGPGDVRPNERCLPSPAKRVGASSAT